MSYLTARMPESLKWVLVNAVKVTDILAKHPWLSPWCVLRACDSILRGVAQVVFVNNPVSGILILLGLFLADLIIGSTTVFCTLIAFLASKVLLDLPDSQIGAGLPLFSPVLVGSVTASLFPLFFNAPITPALWGYMGLASVFSVCVFAGLGTILSPHGLPAYTLPFNVATSVLFLGLRGAGYATPPAIDPATDPATNVTADVVDDMTLSGDVNWNKVWVGAVLSAGQVWAVESMPCSILIYVGMLVCSPLLTASCFIAGVVGTLTALLVSSAPYDLVYAGVWGYNAFLAGGAIMFFVVPSPRVVVLAIVNAMLATFIQAALIPVFQQNHLPVFTFPFCLASLLVLAAASSTSFQRVTNPTVPEIHLIEQRQESGAEVDREGGKETVLMV